MGKEGLNSSEANTLLNKHSGIIGISGVSSDMREIITEMKQGNKRAQFTFDVFCYRIKKYIGAYIAAMGGADAIVFTGGIGENSSDVRKACCDNLGFLGIELDEASNTSKEKEKAINSPTSRVKVFVVPTNEELMIAIDTVTICNGLKPN
jgi:acetate kinase